MYIRSLALLAALLFLPASAASLSAAPPENEERSLQDRVARLETNIEKLQSRIAALEARLGRIAEAAKPAAPPPNLAGTWTMSLPAGFEHQVTLTDLGDGQYRLRPRSLNSSGVYRLDENKLVIETPGDERLTGFEWRIASPNKLVLVGQPDTSRTGSSYLGATLVRREQNEAEPDDARP